MAARYLSVGRIGRAHGVLGEVRVEIETDAPEDRFVVGREVLVGRDVDNLATMTIESVRPHRSWLLVRFNGAPDRDVARTLTGARVYIPADEARELNDNEYYVFELIGLEVFTVSGEAVGTVKSFIETGSADVLVIQTEDREHLIPLTAEVVRSIDTSSGKMVINPLPGLLE